MTVLRVTVPDQYFCTKHPDLNITARERKKHAGAICSCLSRNIHLFREEILIFGEIFTSAHWGIVIDIVFYCYRLLLFIHDQEVPR